MSGFYYVSSMPTIKSIITPGTESVTAIATVKKFTPILKVINCPITPTAHSALSPPITLVIIDFIKRPLFFADMSAKISKIERKIYK
jgi:hypothetical protein